MTYLLDTDTLTHLLQGHPGVVRHLGELDGPDVGTTVITRIEMLRGRFDSVLKAADGDELLRARERLRRTEEFLSRISIFDLGEPAARRFDRLRTANGTKSLGRADLLIASLALESGATLVTRNLRHFRPVIGLSLANWVD